MNQEFIVTKINDYVYQFNDPMGVLSTLIIGSEKALLIDTGYGIWDLKQEVLKYIKTPLLVVNTHGHLDHANGNYLFDEVYIHEKDINLCLLHTSKEYRLRNIVNAKKKNILPEEFDEEKYLNQKCDNLKSLPSNNKFHLGNISLEIIEIPGHTNGSIALYIKELKLMITSDGACPYVWLFLEESAPLSTYIKSVKKLLQYDFEFFLVGHGAGLLPKSFMKRFLDVAQKVDINKSLKVSFEGFDSRFAYSFCEKELYQAGHCGVIYNLNKLS